MNELTNKNTIVGNGSDFSFDDVLMFIESGETIPVIGPELLTASANGGGTLYESLAGPLAAELKIDLSKINDSKSLNSIIVESDVFRNRRQMVYPRLKGVLDRLVNTKSFPVPEPLKKLAAIAPFQLFLSTTFDALLTTAINQTRFNGNPGTLALAYSPSRFDDLPVDFAENPRATVYHLFGRASAQPEYAVTDGDVLEFLHSMQSRESRPQRLFDKLYRSNLLLLGVGFPDWLARFFLRVAKNSRLWETRDRIEIVADSRLNQNESLVYFVNQFSRETSIYGGGAVDFVNKLYERWMEKEREKAGNGHGSPVMVEEAVEEEMKPGAVFISYASDNREQAKRIRDALDEKGIEVWYDRDQLHAGNFYESKIRNNIRTCSLFLPVISNQATERTEAFFRKEWCWAVDRLPEFFGARRPFIVPVVVDETPPDHGQLPEEFSSVQWINAPGGKLEDDSVERVREALRSVRKRERVNA